MRSGNIKEWNDDDRPREKLIVKGKSSLSDVELLAILIGSGTVSQNAIDISRTVLQAVNNDINQLARLSHHDLKRFAGIGDAKAVSIITALELGRRRKEKEVEVIKSSSDVHMLLKQDLMDLSNEEFWVILLNRRNGVIKKSRISSGGITGTVVDPRMIFKLAVEVNACSMILVHNHPSGNTKPSTQDIQLTKKMKSAGEMMEIQVLDHVIFANASYFSFADEGMM